VEGIARLAYSGARASGWCKIIQRRCHVAAQTLDAV
jgi:hypothetical protein